MTPQNSKFWRACWQEIKRDPITPAILVIMAVILFFGAVK